MNELKYIKINLIKKLINNLINIVILIKIKLVRIINIDLKMTVKKIQNVIKKPYFSSFFYRKLRIFQKIYITS